MEPLDTVAGTSSAIERIDHLGIASADNRAAVSVWTGKLGCELESEQTDMEVMIAVEISTSNKHGVVYHSREPVPVGRLRVSFITVGDTELEFLQNFDPQHPALIDHSSSGTTKQDQGAITTAEGLSAGLERGRAEAGLRAAIVTGGGGSSAPAATQCRVTDKLTLARPERK